MRILSKIKKNYGDIIDIIKNSNSHLIDNIKSMTFDGANLYILANDLLVYSINNETLNPISSNVSIINGKKIVYASDNIYVLDNNQLYIYDILNDTYNLLINGTINNFNCCTDYIIYDKNNYIYKYNISTHITSRINNLPGNSIDMVSDNQNVFTMYDTYVKKTNYINGSTSNIIINLSNLKTITYDGLLIYLRSEDYNNELYKVYTKDGLEYTEQKLNSLTGYQDILYDGNYVYYTENNKVFRFNESNVFYNYNMVDVEKIRYNKYDYLNPNELVILKDGNLTISKGSHFETFEVNFSNIIDYGYTLNEKIIINNSNIYILTNTTNEIPKNINISNSDISSYYTDTNITSEINSNIICLSDGSINHIYNDNGIGTNNVNTKVYKNDKEVKAITFDNNNQTYYFTDDSKIIKYTKEFNTVSQINIDSNALPNILPSLNFWFDGSDTNYIFTDDLGNVSVSANGDPVARWNNKNGNVDSYVYNLDHTTLPVWNENSGINFTSANIFYSSLSLTNDFTLILVVDTMVDLNIYYYYAMNDNPGAQPAIISGSGSITMFGDGGGDFGTGLSGKQLLSLKFGEFGTVYGYLNGNKVFENVGVYDYQNYTIQNIGGIFNLVPFPIAGNIYEFIGYNEKISENDRYSIENYLANKWNINYSVPTNIHTTESSNVIIKENSLLDSNYTYNKLEFDSGNVYINELSTGNVFSISSNSNVVSLLTLDTFAYNSYQDGSNVYIVDGVNNIKRYNMDTNQIEKNININFSPLSVLKYNGNILIGTQNYIRKYDNNLEELDTFENPFYKGNFDKYIGIKEHLGNIFVNNKIRNTILELKTNGTDIVSNIYEYTVAINQKNLLPEDIDIYNGNLYVGCFNDSYIMKYHINNSNIVELANISLKERLDRELTINHVLYNDTINGLFVATSNGLYVLDSNLSNITHVYDKYNNLNCLSFYNEYIYTVDTANTNDLYKYSYKHYLTSTSFSFTSQANINNIHINNYNQPTKIVNNNQVTYVLDNNNLLYFNTDTIEYVYSLYNYNKNNTSNVIDIKIDDTYLYVLNDNSSIDVLNISSNPGNITATYSNVDAKLISIPLIDGSFYYISNDNKIKLYKDGNISIILENRGILVDEQSLYIYNNLSINAFQKNNTGMTQLDENIYYSDRNHLYNLNKNSITEDLGISSYYINSVTNDNSNIIICTQNSVQTINPYDLPVVSLVLYDNLNIPFKAILANDFYYISDTFNHRIVKMNKNTNVKSIVYSGLNFPRGLDYKDGYLYIVDSGSDKIIKINANTSVKTDFSQGISGIVDILFSNSELYITSLLQNSVFKIDTLNNNVLTTYFDIEKPYFIDYNENFLVSRDLAISMSILSYSELKDLVTSQINQINILISNNQAYTINTQFKLWIDSQINNALGEKNMNKRYEQLVQINQLLNIMNAGLDYSDTATSTLSNDIDIFKNRMYLVLQSIMKMFGTFFTKK